MTTTDPGRLAPELRRHAIDAARSKVTARTKRDEHQATGQMFGYVTALKMIIAAGLDNPGTAPPAGSYEPRMYLDELARFLGSPDHARQLGFDIREGS